MIGGNAGSQSATLMIRVLAVGDVKTKDWIRLFGKEFFVSLLLGITMALGVSLLSFFQAPSVTPVLAISMVITVVTGSLLGMLLPFLLTKLRIDPATASVPLITSACDIIGILIYLSFASWYFGI
ncbi:magnesium transporter [Myroides albus]|nr:magnesium transporter [Myroides albus]